MPPKKAAKKTQDERYDWMPEASTSSDITPLHRRKAAGLHGLTPCPIHHSTDNSRHPSRSSRASTIDSDYQSKKETSSCTAKRCAKNSRCYNHLGVEEVMKGTKEQYVLDKLGDGPERRQGSRPAGLRNLGATCYANAFLQVWYRNISFRNGVYKAAQSSTRTPMYHLAMVFASLQLSQRAVVDPTPLVESLGLNKGTQQDAAEFSKLFTQNIADAFARQPDPAVKTVINDLFEGTLAHVVKCLRCNKTSQRDQTFLELDINLKKNATLEDCIENSFQVETLSGDNRYRCQHCKSLQNAERWTVMRRLPPVLNISLMRFKYNASGRVKSKDKIRYKRIMQLGGVAWKLKAAVVHVGASAYHGHFKCDVYDEELEKWIDCNDEVVSDILNPAKKRKITGLPDDYIECDQVYMLIYQKDDAGPVDQPSEAIVRQVEKDDQALEEELDERAVRKERAEDDFGHLHGAKLDVTSRLSGVRTISHRLDSLPSNAGIEEQDTHIIPTSALETWIKSTSVDQLYKGFDFDYVRCSHGGLDPDKGEYCRLISEEAWDRLGAYDPTLTTLEPCTICVEEEYEWRKRKAKLADQIASFEDLNAEYDQRAYHVSRSWLDLWRRGETVVLPSDPKYSLFCQHASRWDGNHKTTLITGEAFALLQSIYVDLKSYTDDEPTCGECAVGLAVDTEALSAWSQQITDEKSMVRKWLKGPSHPVVFEENFYALPPGWWDEWNDWLRGQGVVARATLDMGICEHGKLDWDPTLELARYTNGKGWEEIQARYGGEAQSVIVRFGSGHPAPGKKNAINHVEPAVCEECRVKRAAKYDTTRITIVLGTGEGNVADVNMGRGRVTRSKVKQWTMDVKKKTTVKEIKLDIMEHTEASPISQTIRHGGRILDSDETMESAGVLAKDTLFCEIVEEVEVIEVDVDEGFGGTALLGGISCPHCTYTNNPSAVDCGMCELPMKPQHNGGFSS